MATCKFCGEKTGWFSNAHDSCLSRNSEGIASIKATVVQAVEAGTPYSNLAQSLLRVATSSYIDTDTLRKLIVESWSNAAECLATEELISFDRSSQMHGFYEDAGLTMDDLVGTPGFSACTYSVQAWAITQGMPLLCRTPHPFNLKEDELPLTFFDHMLYGGEATNSLPASYSGISIPLGHGFRYNTGSYKSRSAAANSVRKIDSGCLLLTTKHLYFGGAHKSIRLSYQKIVTVTTYGDGIGVFRDTATAKLEVFAFPTSSPYAAAFLARVCQILATPESQAIYSNQKILSAARSRAAASSHQG